MLCSWHHDVHTIEPGLSLRIKIRPYVLDNQCFASLHSPVSLLLVLLLGCLHQAVGRAPACPDKFKNTQVFDAAHVLTQLVEHAACSTSIHAQCSPVGNLCTPTSMHSATVQYPPRTC